MFVPLCCLLFAFEWCREENVISFVFSKKTWRDRKKNDANEGVQKFKNSAVCIVQPHSIPLDAINLILVWLFPLNHVFVYLGIFHATIHSLHLSVSSANTPTPPPYLSSRSTLQLSKKFPSNFFFLRKLIIIIVFLCPSFLSPLFCRYMHAVNEYLSLLATSTRSRDEWRLWTAYDADNGCTKRRRNINKIGKSSRVQESREEFIFIGRKWGTATTRPREHERNETCDTNTSSTRAKETIKDLHTQKRIIFAYLNQLRRTERNPAGLDLRCAQHFFCL